jgi:cysteine desulfurase
MHFIYLDNNATTPLLPEVREAMLAVEGESFGNPSSSHWAGRRARRALEEARDRVAACLGAFPDEVIFTSGGTEANNLAIFGLVALPPARILVSSVEHPSVSEPVAHLGARGFQLDTLPVDGQGVCRIEDLPRLVYRDTHLTAVMLANNETGAIQPVENIAAQLPAGSAFHCDAVQAVGRMPVEFHRLDVTTLSLSAHKFHGPKGIGALLIRRGRKLAPLLRGGHQQQGTRPGTESPVLAVGLARALEIACKEMDKRRDHVRSLRERFLSSLHDRAAPVILNGPAEGGMPHTLNLSFPGCNADALLMNLDLAGVACSTGSACSSGSLLPSPVLQAMGVPEELLHSAMRFSLSFQLSEADVAEAAERIAGVVRRLRGLADATALKPV